MRANEYVSADVLVRRHQEHLCPDLIWQHCFPAFEPLQTAAMAMQWLPLAILETLHAARCREEQ